VARVCDLTKLGIADELSTIITMIVSALPGNVWGGKEVLFKALISLTTHCHSRMSTQQAEVAMRAVMVECARKCSLMNGVTQEYQLEALTCLGVMGKQFSHVCLFDEGRDALTRYVARDVDDTAVAEDRRQQGLDEKMTREEQAKTSRLAAAAYGCLGALWPNVNEEENDALVKVRATQSRHMEWMVETLASGLRSGLSWNVRVAILIAMQRFFKCVDTNDTGVATNALDAMMCVVALNMGDNKYAVVRKECIEVVNTIARLSWGTTKLLECSQRAPLLRAFTELSGDKEPVVLRALEGARAFILRLKAYKPPSTPQPVSMDVGGGDI